MTKNVKKEINKKVVILSIIAIICFVLTYMVHWLFIIPIGVILWINQKELFGKK